MEYIYAALLLHKAGKAITAESLNKVIEASGAKADDAKAKVVAEALKGVNIEDAIKQAAVAPVAAVAAPAETKAEKKEEKEEKKSEEAAAQGLASLFG